MHDVKQSWKESQKPLLQTVKQFSKNQQQLLKDANLSEHKASKR